MTDERARIERVESELGALLKKDWLPAAAKLRISATFPSEFPSRLSLEAIRDILLDVLCQVGITEGELNEKGIWVDVIGLDVSNLLIDEYEFSMD